MKMKIILPIVLIILIGLTGLVYAVGDFGRGYEYGQISINLDKGWNLVSVWAIRDAFASNSFVKKQIQEKDIKAIFFYDRYNKYYIQAFPNNEESKFQKFLESKGDDLKEHGAYVNSAMWVYSDKEQTISSWTTDAPYYIKNVGLNAGWNFLAITPELKGMSYNDFKGDCTIEKICDYQRNNWECVDANNLGTNKVADTDSDLWKGIIIKVSSDCSLGSNGITPPPELPEDSYISNQCTMTSPLGCDDNKISVATGISLVLRNGAGEDITVSSVNIVNCGIDSTSQPVADGGTATITIPTCTPVLVAGNKFNGAITVTYIKTSGGTFSHTSTGTLVGSVI